MALLCKGMRAMLPFSSKISQQPRFSSFSRSSSARPLRFPRNRLVSPISANGDGKVPLVASIDEEATNVTGDFCSIDASGKKVKNRSVAEMEQVKSNSSDRRPGVTKIISCVHDDAGLFGGHDFLLL